MFDPKILIRDQLGDIPLILMLRNQVDRYLSACTHHMMQGRVPTVEVVDTVVDDFGIVELGRYDEIYDHDASKFSNIRPYIYDGLCADEMGLMTQIFADLDVPLDVTEEALKFPTNDKTVKQQKHKIKVLPTLSDDLVSELKHMYAPHIVGISSRIGRDLSPWLT